VHEVVAPVPRSGPDGACVAEIRLDLTTQFPDPTLRAAAARKTPTVIHAFVSVRRIPDEARRAPARNDLYQSDRLTPCGTDRIALAPWCEGRSKAGAGPACTARGHGPAIAVVAGLAQCLDPGNHLTWPFDLVICYIHTVIMTGRSREMIVLSQNMLGKWNLGG
jgi:hypothetical protein